MANILYSFKLKFPQDKEPIMFSELSDGRYAKTYLKNEKITIDFIDLQEYASAVAFFHLRLD